MWRSLKTNDAYGFSVAVGAATWCVLSVLVMLLTCAESGAQSYLAGTWPTETRPSRSGRPGPSGSAQAPGGTGVETSGTTVETRQLPSSMRNTDNIQHRGETSVGRTRQLDAERPAGNQPYPTDPKAYGVSRSMGVREGLSQATAPFDGSTTRGSVTEPFGNKESVAAPPDRSPDSSFRRYIDTPDSLPSSPPSLR